MGKTTPKKRTRTRKVIQQETVEINVEEAQPTEEQSKNQIKSATHEQRYLPIMKAGKPNIRGPVSKVERVGLGNLRVVHTDPTTYTN